MKKKINRKKLEKTEKLVVKNRTRNQTGKTIFPNGVQVGLNDHAFKKGLRVFGKIDTSDDILLFGNSIAAAVLDIELNPSSIVMFGDPADKEIFIQPSTITADAAYSGRQMSYDGLALSAKDVKKDFSYRPFFAGITGDNGVFSISKVVINAVTGSATGSFKNPLSGNVKLFDSHNTQFMTLNFSSDASTGDLTISPFLDQTRTNNKLINDITLKIPFAAKSNNPKPLVVNKEVHVQKLEFPVTANYFTTPSVYVLRKNASNQFSTLDLKAVPYSVNYVEGYNYGSGATEVSASNLIPNATGSVGSVNTLANGSFTIKSVRDLFCSSSSASTMTQPATTGSDRYKVRLTALSGADDNATFAAREIETLYKTTTGLIGSDRILQQFIIQETRESVTVESTDPVLYVKAKYDTGMPVFFHAVTGSNVDGIRTIANPNRAATNNIKYYSEQTTFAPLTPNKLALTQSCFFIPMYDVFSGSSITSNLAGQGTSLMGLTSSNAFTAQTKTGVDHNESIQIPAGSYHISINCQFTMTPAFVSADNYNFAFYVAAVFTKTAASSHDVFDNQPINRSTRYDLFNPGHEDFGQSRQAMEFYHLIDGGAFLKWERGARYVSVGKSSDTGKFSHALTLSSTTSTRITIVPMFQFGPLPIQNLADPADPPQTLFHEPYEIPVPTIKRTNLTLTVTEL